jgi:hypothetical protein
LTLNELSVAAHSAAVAKGFYERERPFPELVMLVVTELAEAVEADRHGWTNARRLPIITRPTVEEWRPIESLNGEYEASNWGNVRSNDLLTWNGKVYYSKDGRNLKPGLTKTGYLTISPRGKTRKVHHLVAETFIGPSNGLICNHMNGDKTCNWSTNLEWVTHSQNNIHAIKTGLSPRLGVLTHQEKTSIAFRFKGGETAPSIWSDYKERVSLSAIKAIRQGGIGRYTESVELEIADTFIRLFDLCGFYGIDIDSHVAAKMAYNTTRPPKHGKAY